MQSLFQIIIGLEFKRVWKRLSSLSYNRMLRVIRIAGISINYRGLAGIVCAQKHGPAFMVNEGMTFILTTYNN